MPTIDEFGAAERWKLQPKPIRQQTHKWGFIQLTEYG